MKIRVADIETDGLLGECTKIHSLCIKDHHTGKTWSCHDHPGADYTVAEGIKILNGSDLVVFHNGIGFDHPALKKLSPIYKVPEDKIFDTLIVSRLVWSDIKDIDLKKQKKGQFPGKLIGSHSLAAWGHRVGDHKGDYDGGWERWSPEMQRYCVQDVEVTCKLLELIFSKNYSEDAIALEHGVAWICAQQERNGFKFDVDAAEKLYAQILGEYNEFSDDLRSIYKPWYVKDGGTVTPKRSNSRWGYWGHYEIHENGDKEWVGYPYTKVKLNVFNPNSRDHIADRLQKINGWKPKEKTPSGKPKVDESVLSALKWKEAKQLAELLTLKKLLGQLGDGDNAWLKHVKNGRIHGRIITNGAVTGRATHSSPNIAQVPSIGAKYGAECRELFTTASGNTLLGCDVSGLELRMLGHFMAEFDGGAYANIVINGDIHWENVKAIGLTKADRDEHNHPEHKIYRDGMKTFIYAFLYGAGDFKIAQTVLEIGLKLLKDTGDDWIIQRWFNGKKKLAKGSGAKIGKQFRNTFLEGLPALKKVVNAVQKEARKGYIIGLDGRRLKVRSEHAALNTKLQSAGALVCKRWMIQFHKLLAENGLASEVWQVAWVHDELQCEVRGYCADLVGKLCVEAIEEAGNWFNIRVELTGEYNIGNNWKETH